MSEVVPAAEEVAVPSNLADPSFQSEASPDFGPKDLNIKDDNGDYEVEEGDESTEEDSSSSMFIQLKMKTKDFGPVDLNIDGHTGQEKETHHYAKSNVFDNPLYSDYSQKVDQHKQR
jgi:hypothetical protein